MRKLHFESCVVAHKMPQHEQIKKELLELIDNSWGVESVCDKPINNITKTDWDHGSDFVSREWVHYFKPHLMNILTKMVNYSGFTIISLVELWYQQYRKNSIHNWHTHGQNFTGVYYVDLPNTSPKTQIVSPYSNEIVDLDVNEGDVIMFPSTTIHRAPPNHGDACKTIVSFNFNAFMPDGPILDLGDT